MNNENCRDLADTISVPQCLSRNYSNVTAVHNAAYPQLFSNNVATISKIMALIYYFAFFLFATYQRVFVEAGNECYAKWLGGIITPIDECDLVKGTVTVRLENLVDRPECLNIGTAIGIKFREQEVETDWDSTKNLDQSTEVTFNSTESLCFPVNVTIGLGFSDGQNWHVHRVNYEFDSSTCIDTNLGESEKEDIQTKCPNLNLDSFLTTTEASTSETKILSSANSNKEVKTGTISPTTIISCSLILCTTLIICAVAIILVQRRKRQIEEEAKSKDDWEVKREYVDIGQELGKGCFGAVYKGTLKDSRQVW